MRYVRYVQPAHNAPCGKQLPSTIAVRASGIVPVAVIQVRYVVKRKGMGPGKVTYSHEDVVFVEPWKG